MFQNLSWRSLFSLRREPALWAALVVAAANIIAQGITGDLTWTQAIEAAVILLFGFVVRGQVSPTVYLGETPR